MRHLRALEPELEQREAGVRAREDLGDKPHALARDADDDQPVPHLEVRADERIAREVDDVVHRWRAEQRTVEPVGPPVVRADEPPNTPGQLAADLRTAVAADVEQRAQAVREARRCGLHRATGA